MPRPMMEAMHAGMMQMMGTPPMQDTMAGGIGEGGVERRGPPARVLSSDGDGLAAPGGGLAGLHHCHDVARFRQRDRRRRACVDALRKGVPFLEDRIALLDRRLDVAAAAADEDSAALVELDHPVGAQDL